MALWMFSSAVVLVAVEEATIEGPSAGALDVHVLRDAFLEAGDGHDDLEGGTRRELAWMALFISGWLGLVMSWFQSVRLMRTAKALGS